MELVVLKIGGFGISGMTNEITYCLANERKWRHLTSIPHVEQCNFGTAVFINELYVFVSGGLDKDTVLPTVCYYDTVFDTWWSCQPMLTPRADHVMITMGNKIYVCGGWTEDPETRVTVLVNTIDVYDVVHNIWDVVTRVPTPRYHAGIVGVSGKIYFITDTSNYGRKECQKEINPPKIGPTLGAKNVTYKNTTKGPKLKRYPTKTLYVGERIVDYLYTRSSTAGSLWTPTISTTTFKDLCPHSYGRIRST